MTEIVMNTNTLPEFLLKMISAEKVRVKVIDSMIQLIPVIENFDCTIGLRGMFTGDPNLTVDRYLERKRAEKELDL